MHLIYWCLQGNPLPNTLPQTLIDQAMSTVLYNTNAQGLIFKPDNKGRNFYEISLLYSPFTFHRKFDSWKPVFAYE
jgi:hypothetical protein